MWIVNALSIVCSQMLKLSRNNQNIKMLGDPPPPEHSANSNIGIFCYWVLLHYNTSLNQLPVGLMVLSYGMVHFWRSRTVVTNLPKVQNYLVALIQRIYIETAKCLYKTDLSHIRAYYILSSDITSSKMCIHLSDDTYISKCRFSRLLP